MRALRLILVLALTMGVFGLACVPGAHAQTSKDEAAKSLCRDSDVNRRLVQIGRQLVKEEAAAHQLTAGPAVTKSYDDSSHEIPNLAAQLSAIRQKIGAKAEEARLRALPACVTFDPDFQADCYDEEVAARVAWLSELARALKREPDINHAGYGTTNDSAAGQAAQIAYNAALLEAITKQIKALKALDDCTEEGVTPEPLKPETPPPESKQPLHIVPPPATTPLPPCRNSSAEEEIARLNRDIAQLDAWISAERSEVRKPPMRTQRSDLQERLNALLALKPCPPQPKTTPIPTGGATPGTGVPASPPGSSSPAPTPPIKPPAAPPAKPEKAGFLQDLFGHVSIGVGVGTDGGRAHREGSDNPQTTTPPPPHD